MSELHIGLTAEEAAARLSRDGPNVLPHRDSRSTVRIMAEVVREPMLALLLVAGLAYLLLGDRLEAILLLIFASFSVFISVIQEARSEKVLAALRDLSSPRALVIRDGKRLRIPGSEVVRGDLMLLEQGDRVPADTTLLEASDFQVDESLLTGESVPVDKQKGDAVFSGTLIVRGSALGETTATAGATRMGQIGAHLAAIDLEPPRLRRETGHIVRLAGLGAILVAGSVMLLFGLSRGSWLEALLAGIAIGMAMLPEEFPVVLATFLAMGAWRISQARVLTRRAAAIETLGSITVLCTDKTGTLTENRMAVARLWLPDGQTAALSQQERPQSVFRNLIEIGIRGSAAAPIDPMEIALHASGAHWMGSADMPAMIYQFGLRPELLAMSNVWQNDQGAIMLAAKGAPEAIATLCHLKARDHKVMLAAAEAMARMGQRVLGVASATTDTLNRDGSQLDHHYRLAGLIGFADPLRPSAPAAVSECQSAGIRVKMITGDYPVTAQVIAAQAGIPADDVHARIMPEEKLRIVEKLKISGEIVAMTGDGVNDAPSLKAAHVGIAMGGRGTDVAREAASLVLLDDDFSAIVKAIRLGRRIYANIRKAMAFIFAVHVPIAGLALLPLMLDLPLLFGPIHIALLEMIIDPACALVFEAEGEDQDIMQRPPRDPAERLFTSPMILWSVFQGSVALALLSGIWLGATRYGLPEDEVRGLVFLSLVGVVVGLITVNRVGHRGQGVSFSGQNKPMLFLGIGMATVFGILLSMPAAVRILRFGTVHSHDLAIAGVAVLALFLLLTLARPATSPTKAP